MNDILPEFSFLLYLRLLQADPSISEAVLPNGLIRGHAYSITDVKYADVSAGEKHGKIPLIRIRNPWGNEAEWNGAWSDKYVFHNFLIFFIA